MRSNQCVVTMPFWNERVTYWKVKKNSPSFVLLIFRKACFISRCCFLCLLVKLFKLSEGVSWSLPPPALTCHRSLPFEVVHSSEKFRMTLSLPDISKCISFYCKSPFIHILKNLSFISVTLNFKRVVCFLQILYFRKAEMYFSHLKVLSCDYSKYKTRLFLQTIGNILYICLNRFQTTEVMKVW